MSFSLDESILLALFPRGPGLYFHPLKILLVLAIYCAWVKTCWWVDRDARTLKLATATWNPVILGGGLLGLLLVFMLPIFWAGALGLVALYLAPTLFYVGIRNQQVTEEDKVLTPRHLKLLANRYLNMNFEIRGDKKGGKAIPVRFIGKGSGAAGEDNTHVSRAREGKGYQAALEMVHNAILMRATDIHMEPTRDEMSVRYRIDGILQPAPAMDRAQGDSVLNIFKVLATLDITEKRKAQDGSFSAEVQAPAETLGKKRPTKKIDDETGEVVDNLELEEDLPVVTRQVDFRIATAGSVAGEKMVMRILDRSRQVNDLAQVGLKGKIRDQIRKVVTQPHGMFIVCGPTGAGKSTTLYGCLSEIDRYQRNVITVENPVEYHIDNVTQIEINPKAGKTFATELRSILRQDPDVIYIGEIRDQETAEIACQAAQTGHMVFTTVHANDTITAMGRLLNLGVEPFMVASSVSAVLGQRLVRLLCRKCKKKYQPNPDLVRKLGLPADRIKWFYRPPKEANSVSDDEDETGSSPKCPHCSGTGYRGRTGIFELFVVTDKIKELIKENPNLEAIKQEALKAGMVPLMQDGMRVVVEGDTSIEELLRVAK